MHIGRETFYGAEHRDTPPKSSDIYYLSISANQILAYAAQIQYFIQHTVTVTHTNRIGTRSIVTSRVEVHTFAVVWHYQHSHGMALNSPAPVFMYKLDPAIGWENFVPIRRIAGRCTKMPHYNYEKWKRNRTNCKQLNIHALPDHTAFYLCPLPRKM